MRSQYATLSENVSQYARNWLHFENVRNHLAINGVIPRVHGNVKRVPRWKTKITIDITVATDFLENYAEFMDYQVLVEMSIALLNRLHYFQVINRSIVILLQVCLKTIAR